MGKGGTVSIIPWGLLTTELVGVSTRRHSYIYRIKKFQQEWNKKTTSEGELVASRQFKVQTTVKLSKASLHYDIIFRWKFEHPALRLYVMESGPGV